jgi:LCP family protein required for cell wall assembly
MKRFINTLTKSKGWFKSLGVVSLLTTLSTLYFVYSINRLNGIENVIRYITIFVTIIISFILFIFTLKRMIMSSKRRKDKVLKNLFLMFISLVYAFALFFIAFNIDKVMTKLGNVSSTDTVYSTSLITLSSNKISDIKDIGNDKIGILIDEYSYEGFIIPYEVKKELNLKNEYMRYDNYVVLLQELLEGKIKYVFVPSNYKSMFNSTPGLEDIETKTKEIYSKEKKVKIKVERKEQSNLTKPFTVLIMGVDSHKDGIKGASFNGDSLILLTFNPKTLSSTILSIPRDTYTNITCFKEQRRNKITHAAWYGETCMINTISKMFDIKIDYYVKINFKGVVDLVNAVGGVEVDVPYSFCEQDSLRRWGKNTVYVKKGLQTLNGEQALALARNRHPNPSRCSREWTNYTSNDFVRGQMQQIVVKGLMNKVKDVRSLDIFYEILDTISNNMETSLSTKEILSLYDVAKKAITISKDSDVSEVISMQRLYLDGYSQMIYDYSQNTNQGMKMLLYNYVPYTGSINDIRKAMLINLGKEEYKPIKEFEFSVDEPYKEKVIGKGGYKGSSYPMLENLVGKTKEYATIYLMNNNLQYEIKEVKATSSSQKLDTVISQDIPASTDIAYLNKITLEVVNEEYKPATITIDCSLEENKDDTHCLLPSFTDKSYSYVSNWFIKRYPKLNPIFIADKCEDTNSDICVVYKNLSAEKSLYDYLNDDELIIKYEFKDKSTE